MNNLINKKIIISFILFNAIPAILVLLDIYLSWYKTYDNFLFLYNITNSIIFWFISEKTSSIYLTIFLTIYNLCISFFLYNLSGFTRKHIISISIIIAIFISFIGWILTTA